MKVTVATIRVVGNDLYTGHSNRWLETYKKFKPALKHELIVVNCDHDRPDDLFDSVATRQLTYKGGGWDCGTWQWLGNMVNTDLLVCCNSSTYFHREGWLERFVAEVYVHGLGLYGSMASYEISPHMRTPCYVFQPNVMIDYPILIDSRPKTYTFECAGMKDTFTSYCRRKGFVTRLVTWDGSYDLPDWRKPANIFRRGDQSNVMVKDKHADAYEASSPEGKAFLEKLADGS